MRPAARCYSAPVNRLACYQKKKKRKKRRMSGRCSSIVRPSPSFSSYLFGFWLFVERSAHLTWGLHLITRPSDAQNKVSVIPCWSLFAFLFFLFSFYQLELLRVRYVLWCHRVLITVYQLDQKHRIFFLGFLLSFFSSPQFFSFNSHWFDWIFFPKLWFSNGSSPSFCFLILQTFSSPVHLKVSLSFLCFFFSL